MTQQTFEEVMNAEIEEAISIAEEELSHDLRDSYLNASRAKQKEADLILMDIRAIYDNTDDEGDKSLEIFAKVLKLETVLGLC